VPRKLARILAAAIVATLALQNEATARLCAGDSAGSDALCAWADAIHYRSNASYWPNFGDQAERGFCCAQHGEVVCD
jgi:hypothetical protein